MLTTGLQEPDLYTTHKKRPNVANYTAQIYMSVRVMPSSEIALLMVVSRTSPKLPKVLAVT
jgi:hypothetical protein